jgi:hypothetical protein
LREETSGVPKRSAYRQKAEAQLDELRARLDLLKATARNMSADARIATEEQVDLLEKRLGQARGRLSGFAEVAEDTAGTLADTVQSSWRELKREIDKLLR